MKIVIFTNDSIFSFLILRDLLEKWDPNTYRILFLPAKNRNSNYVKTAIALLKEGGFRFFGFKIVLSLLSTALSFWYRSGIGDKPYSVQNLAHKNKINYFFSDDCNSQFVLDDVAEFRPDVLLSVNVYQKIGEEVLAVPQVAALNVHFGLLPKYRGRSPYIWALSKNEKAIGITVHHLVNGFDEGDIMVQQKVKISSCMSAFSLYCNGCRVARSLIMLALQKLETNDFGVAQKGQSTYFSFPSKDTIRNLKKNGFCLIKVTDVLHLLRSI